MRRIFDRRGIVIAIGGLIAILIFLSIIANALNPADVNNKTEYGNISFMAMYNEHFSFNSKIQSNSEMPNWKIYINQAYSFKIKYPGHWKVRETPLPVYPDTFSVQVAFDSPSNQNKVSIQVRPKGDEGMIRESLKIMSEAQITMSGLQGTKITGLSHKQPIPPVTLILIRKGSYLYIIEGEGNTFNQMLCTFKFTK